MKNSINKIHLLFSLILTALMSTPMQAQTFREYGDEDLCNTGAYSSNPKAGATLYGLAPGVVTTAQRSFGHNYPFSPTPTDYAGTDQIYVGSVQTGTHDGYSRSQPRINGPQVITLDYGSLLPGGQAIRTLTLGIGADDFQYRTFGQPFTAAINGVTDVALTNALNALNQTGPYEQFFTIGIDPAILKPSNVLTLRINEGGDGGDGWAIDFLTVGVTSASPENVPEPGAIALLLASGLTSAGLLLRRRQKLLR